VLPESRRLEESHRVRVLRVNDWWARQKLKFRELSPPTEKVRSRQHRRPKSSGTFLSLLMGGGSWGGVWAGSGEWCRHHRQADTLW
jgi:hypothetical protein